MADIGCRYFKWAPITNEPAGALPQYGDVLHLEGLESVNDDPQYNEAKQSGDDHVRNHIVAFKECPLTCGLNEIQLAHYAAMIGATYTPGASGAPGTIVENIDDAPPAGGCGFITSVYTDDDGYQYCGEYYPKVKAVKQGRNRTTKGDTINLTGRSFKLNAVACESGDWHEESDPFDTEDAAKAWVDARVKKYVSGG